MIPTTAASVTARDAVPDFISLLAVIVTLPAARVVAVPSGAIDATLVLLDCHVTWSVRSWLVLSE